MLKYLFAWFGMVIIAVANGTLRQFALLPFFGELPAHQISSVALITLLLFYLLVLARRWTIGSSREAWLIGLMWLALTVGFEFGFGHFIAGQPWSRLLHDFNIVEGRLWSLVLLAILVGPYVVYRAFVPPDPRHAL
jgi:hypothetical protein